jgi:hypothetical protein
VGKSECNAEKRGWSLAVGIDVGKKSLDCKDGQHPIQSYLKKVINSCPFQPSSVETLEKKNPNMKGQEKQQEHDDIRFQRRDPFIYGKNVSVETKPIGVKIGNDDSDNVAQNIQKNQTASLSFDHF